jgi:hypothetical protein
VLDYIEGQGQMLAYYVNELRARAYEGATIYLPICRIHGSVPPPIVLIFEGPDRTDCRNKPLAQHLRFLLRLLQ